jgi:hypothetical protein
MTMPGSKTARVASALFAGLALCGMIALAVAALSRMDNQGALHRWRPPADPRPRVIEGRFETNTSGYAYSYGYQFKATDGKTLSLGCIIHKGGKSYGTPHGCLDVIPEELRGKPVRVGYLDPVLDNGRTSGDHLILKVWRGERLLLNRPVDNIW